MRLVSIRKGECVEHSRMGPSGHARSSVGFQGAPSTRRVLERTEPMRLYSTTMYRPFMRATMDRMSSTALPNVTFSRPPARHTTTLRGLKGAGTKLTAHLVTHLLKKIYIYKKRPLWLGVAKEIIMLCVDIAHASTASCAWNGSILRAAQTGQNPGELADDCMWPGAAAQHRDSITAQPDSLSRFSFFLKLQQLWSLSKHTPIVSP